jgi:hypothetical protein
VRYVGVLGFLRGRKLVISMFEASADLGRGCTYISLPGGIEVRGYAAILETCGCR